PGPRLLWSGGECNDRFPGRPVGLRLDSAGFRRVHGWLGRVAFGGGCSPGCGGARRLACRVSSGAGPPDSRRGRRPRAPVFCGPVVSSTVGFGVGSLVIASGLLASGGSRAACSAGWGGWLSEVGARPAVAGLVGSRVAFPLGPGPQAPAGGGAPGPPSPVVRWRFQRSFAGVARGVPPCVCRRSTRGSAPGVPGPPAMSCRRVARHQRGATSGPTERVLAVRASSVSVHGATLALELGTALSGSAELDDTAACWWRRAPYRAGPSPAREHLPVGAAAGCSLPRGGRQSGPAEAEAHQRAPLHAFRHPWHSAAGGHRAAEVCTIAGFRGTRWPNRLLVAPPTRRAAARREGRPPHDALSWRQAAQTGSAAGGSA